jgi:malonyl-CoA O-methyltransferase
MDVPGSHHKRHCRQVTSRFISYWEDTEPDGLFLAWLAVK